MRDHWFSKDKSGEGEKRLWRNWNYIEETLNLLSSSDDLASTCPFGRRSRFLTGFTEENTSRKALLLWALAVTYKFLSISSSLQLPRACTVIMDAQQVTETSVAVWSNQRLWSIFSIVIWRGKATFHQKKGLHLHFNIGGLHLLEEIPTMLGWALIYMLPFYHSKVNWLLSWEICFSGIIKAMVWSQVVINNTNTSSARV